MKTNQFRKYDLVPVKDIPQARFVTESDLPDLPALEDRMKAVCVKSNGVGLAAVQIGVPLWFCIFGLPHKSGGMLWHFPLVNCFYSSHEKRDLISEEGCLSLPNRHFVLRRYPAVAVQGSVLNLKGKLEPIATVFTTHSSIIVQHEIDHCRGILISDMGLEI